MWVNGAQIIIGLRTVHVYAAESIPFRHDWLFLYFIGEKYVLC